MNSLSLFSHLGLFVQENFLDAETCSRLRAEGRVAPASPAEVLTAPGHPELRLDVRRVAEIDLSAESIQFLQRRSLAIRPDLERHFQTSLVLEEPALVCYRRGDFYRPHRDAIAASQRKVSAVLFLNGPQQEDGFAGGSLVFYGLLGEAQSAGLPLEPREGLLVAFIPNTWHEVEEVTDGERFTVLFTFC